MSANDKKLVIIAAALLLTFAICFFGIKPAVTGIVEAKGKIEELSAKKTEMSNEIAAIPSYEKGLEAAKADYAKTADRVYGDLTNDKIHDAVVDKLVAPSGLSITSFSISPSPVTKTSIAKYEVTVAENGENVGKGGESAENANSKLAHITVSVSGTTDQIITFIDKLNADEGLYIQNTSFATSSEGTAVSVDFFMVLSETFA